MIVTRVNNGNVDVEVYQYGKSMYGGWYANFRYIYNNELVYDGIRRKTLYELSSALHSSNTALKRDVTRFDN